ncbi:MAG: response regulator [Candidatus Krumholzibacteriia bacterium]
MSDRTHRVLFVDDEENILRTLRRLCRREPYEVMVATSGPAALAMLEERPASVIISDYRMPEMTGVEMLARAKNIVPDSVRIILSGFADTQAVMEAINKGEVYRFLAKPWDDHELLTTITRSLEHWDLLQQNSELEALQVKQNDQLKRLNENLESIVAERTRSLSFAQEVLENLPVGVLGISREGEIMLANTYVPQRWPEIGFIPPGTDMDDVLPGEIIALIRASLDAGADGHHRCRLGADEVDLTVSRLGSDEHGRGCVLVLRPQGGDGA